jgi:AcrR family transcriptional regulator
LLRDGPEAVAVQPLSRQLGATKGSFYWHFEGRDDLLGATLERWLQVATADVITASEALSGEPADKARALLARVMASNTEYPGQLRLYATAGHPLIRSALERATEQRVTYIAGLLRAAGVPRAAAARRATMAYAAYLGHAQMTQATPAALPHTASARRALVDEMTRVLVG